MAKRLKVQLFPGWKAIDSPRKDYPYRFSRTASEPKSVLDVASAEYKSGKAPNPSYADLLKLAIGNSIAELVSQEYGDCNFGRYGMAQFHSIDHRCIQRWFLSNGKDFIIVEYQSQVEPPPVELHEVQAIAKSLNLASD